MASFAHSRAMCVVSKPAVINSTNICVARRKDGRVLTFYSAVIKQEHRDNIMVLAVPNPDTVELVDATRAKKLFNLMWRRFWYNGAVAAGGSVAKSMHLRVEKVGSYECSVVRTLPELEHLDPAVFGAIPAAMRDLLRDRYGGKNVGFLVARLDPAVTGAYEPLAYSYVPRDEIVIPTLHFHMHRDGSADTESADWDHNVYTVDCDARDIGSTLWYDNGKAGDEVAMLQSFGIDCKTFTKHTIEGEGARPNADIVLRV